MELSTDRRVPGSIEFPINDPPKHIVLPEPIYLDQIEFDTIRGQHKVVGYPDVFYTIDFTRKPYGKFGYSTRASVSPIVINTDFFRRGEDFSTLIPYARIRATAELNLIIPSIERFTRSATVLHRDIDVKAWEITLGFARNNNDFERLTTFYRLAAIDSTLQETDRHYCKTEVEILDEAISKLGEPNRERSAWRRLLDFLMRTQ